MRNGLTIAHVLCIEFPELPLGDNYEPDTFKLYFADIMNAFSESVVKSVCAYQKFDVKNVVSSPKFIAFFAIRWYTIFAV